MVAPSVWMWAWTQTWRDFRGGSMRLLLVAVALAVAALTAVSFFANRIERGLSRDAAQLLGADVVVVADQPIADAWERQARSDGLRTSRTWVFPSMARAPDERGGDSRLVAIKAVDQAYPLRGRLTIAMADAQGAPSAPQPAPAGGPAAGHAWVDPGLLDILGLRLGDELWLGEAALRIEAVIVSEPDRGAGFMSFAPRVMLNEADLPATGLVQPASRLTYRLAVAGPDAAVAAFTGWAQERLDASGVRGTRLESLEGGRPEMERTLERAEKFLNLVALLAALLCAVAVAIAARGFAQRHLDDCAMLRVLGLSQGTMARAYTLEFALVGLMASALGVLLGFLVHYGFVLLLAGLVESSLPAPGITPVLLGLGMGLTLMMAFGLPPVLQLAQVPPLRVIRRDVGQLKPATLAVLGLGVAGFAALLLTHVGVRRLVAVAMLGLYGAYTFALVQI